MQWQFHMWRNQTPQQTPQMPVQHPHYQQTPQMQQGWQQTQQVSYHTQPPQFV